MRIGFKLRAPGNATCELSARDVGRIELLRSVFSARHRWVDTQRDGAVHLVLAARTSASSATVNGEAYDTYNVFCRSGPTSVSSVSEPGFEFFEMVVSERLAESSCLPNDILSFLKLPIAEMDHLHNLVRKSLLPKRVVSDPVTPTFVSEEQFLGAVEGALRAASGGDASARTPVQNRELIVANAEAIMNEWDPEARLEIEYLSRETGLPRRTIHHIFRESLGIGPMAFYRLKRLHAVSRARADAGIVIFRH